MKKSIGIIMLLLCFYGANVFALGNNSYDEIKAGWADKTIPVKKDANVLTMLKAFNDVWQTTAAKELLANPVNTEGTKGAYDVEVDLANGYLSIYEMGDDGESLSACVWKRNNGHCLFAVVYTKFSGQIAYTVSCFYDYDTAKGIMTPEPCDVTRFEPFCSNRKTSASVRITLPQEGKDVEIIEYMSQWNVSIVHTYIWDGMVPKWSKSVVSNLSELEKIYATEVGEVKDVKFTKYMMLDIDEDDIPELWLSSEDDDYQAIYSIINNDVNLLGNTYYKTHFGFYPGVLCVAGGCGTGCYNIEYVILQDSKVKSRMNEMQEYDMTTDKMKSTYAIGDKDISVAEGERIKKGFGKQIEKEMKLRSMYAK